MNCDEAFTAYLREVSQRVNDGFYKQVLSFVLLYRDCLNKYGWQKLAESECRETRVPLEDQNIQARLLHHRETMEFNEFCAVNNAEVVPEICNEFVTIYMESKNGTRCEIERSLCIDLTKHLCHWFFMNGHTCSKLSQV